MMRVSPSRCALLPVLLLLGSCTWTSAFSADQDQQLLVAAVERALVGDGYRHVEYQGPANASDVPRTVATRSGAATSPFGLTAQVEYVKHQQSTEIRVTASACSLISLQSHVEELQRKIRTQIDQLAQSPRLGVANEPAHSAPAFSGKRHALIVGISTYSDPDFDDLPRAMKDAQALADFLKSPQGGNLTSSQVVLLLNQTATRAEILDRLDLLLRQAREEDMIILYFACHGQAPGPDRSAGRFLVPFDGKQHNARAASIDYQSLVALLDRATVRRQLLFLDCCFAGKVRAAEAIEEDPFRDLAGPNRAVITSTRGNETALDSIPRSTSDNSPFATYLLEALRNEPAADEDHDSVLTTRELWRYLGPKVTIAAGAHDMHPELYGDPDLPVLEWRRD